MAWKGAKISEQPWERNELCQTTTSQITSEKAVMLTQTRSESCLFMLKTINLTEVDGIRKQQSPRSNDVRNRFVIVIITLHHNAFCEIIPHQN